MNSKTDYNRYKDVVRDNFSKAARTYDKYDTIQRQLAGMLLERIPKKPYTEILEVGCGTGNLTMKLKETFSNAHITALDISGDMIEVASDKTKEVDNIYLRVCDIEKYTPDSGISYDLIVSNATFQWVSDLNRTIEKMGWMLNRGGDIVFTTFGPGTYRELQEALSKYYSRKIEFHSNSFCEKTTLETILKKNFRNVEVEEIAILSHYDNVHELLKTIKYTGVSGPGPGIKSVLSPDGLKKIEDIFMKEYGSVKVTGQVQLCRGSK